MTMQQKVLERIKRAVELAGLDFVHNPQHGNTGTVYIQRQETFETVLSFTYMFDERAFDVQVYPAGVKPIYTSGGGRGNILTMFYDNHDDVKIGQLFAFLNQQIEAALKLK